MSKRIRITNETLNAKGFWVKTDGIDISLYETNPIILWMHNRVFRGTNDEVLPIGKMTDIKIKNNEITGIPVFDENDDFACKIKSKYDNGFLNMCSIGIDIIEVSASPEFVKVGQLRETVVKSRLTEVSLVDIGANPDSIVLYRDGKQVELSDNSECLIRLLSDLNQQDNNNQNENQMKQIALKLGLSESATENEILQKITSLQAELSEVAKLKTDIEKQTERTIETLCLEAIRQGKIKADKKQHFIGIGKTMGVEVLQETLSVIEAPARPTEALYKGGTTTTGRDDWNFIRWSKEDPIGLANLRASDPEKYAELAKTIK
jgi:hypothetical protein